MPVSPTLPACVNVTNHSYTSVQRRHAAPICMPRTRRFCIFHLPLLGAGLLEKLSKNFSTLESIQKSLEEYLETKRVAFPRFYFLSNDELLEILAQSKNAQAVQPHMGKCFDGIRRLDFGEDPKGTEIFAMVSGMLLAYTC